MASPSFPGKPANLRIGSEINRGAWGVVYEGDLGGHSVAVKNMHELLREVGKVELERLLGNFRDECARLQALKHPHIVGFIGAFKDPRLGHILVMEKMNENLLQFLQRMKDILALPEQLRVCREITQGIAFLHHQKPPLVHRDLNNKNVMFSAEGVAKIGDFGQSKLKQGVYGLTSTQPGMVLYMPPEALIGGGSIYDESLDIFSLGVLMLEIGTQEPPVQNLAGIGIVSELKRRDKDLKKLDKDHPVRPIVLRCLKDKPKQRPKVKEVLEHLEPKASVPKFKVPSTEESKKKPTQVALPEPPNSIQLRKLQHFVSDQRRRFEEAGFDLDLTYIKPNIVAMGFPAERIEGLYRNSLEEVVRFLDTKHRNHYRVYNLCSERYYDPDKFHGRVALFPFDEYNAPPFELIKPFCVDMEEWFAQSPMNVAVVHSKSGKGRTGTMICAYLLYSGEFQTAKEVLQFFGEARTKNQKGVTIPSQRRYVYYFGYLLHKQVEYSISALLLKGIQFEGLPNYHTTSVHGCAMSFVVRVSNTVIHTSKVYELRRGQSNGEVWLEQEIPLCGDIKMEFYHNPRFGRKEKMCHVWFNTFFVDMHLDMQREEEMPEEKTKHLSSQTSMSQDKRTSFHQPDLPSSTGGASNSPLLGACATDRPEMLDIYFKQDELEKANKDKKHYPTGFKLHLFLNELDDYKMRESEPTPTHELQPGEVECEDDDDHLSDTDSESLSEWCTGSVTNA